MKITILTILMIRAVDPHSFFTDPDPAAFLSANPDPEGKMNADPDPQPCSYDTLCSADL